MVVSFKKIEPKKNVLVPVEKLFEQMMAQMNLHVFRHSITEQLC